MCADTKGHGETLEVSHPIAKMDGNRLKQRAVDEMNSREVITLDLI